YRDCWLISTAKTYITDANMVDKVADGGLMVHYTAISDKAATVNLSVNLQNDSNVDMRGSVEFCLEKGVSKSVKYNLPKGENKTLKTAITINDPHLWSPDSPYLYDMKVLVKDGKGRMIDGYRKKIGVRSIEFSHEKGFILNGKDYPRKLIGANRHQDFAIVGNALSNNLHWRDAAKLREAGMDIIRNAHYPQDPAFMDACDALGLFVIVNTPGWQFWNKEPIFEQRVYSDIRAMVRRDRNSPAVIMWEPILNETWYPEAFAKNVHDIIKEEFPFAPNYTACDDVARGKECFDVIFAHPKIAGNEFSADIIDSTKVYFTREFGDNVDNWNSHNSNSRVARKWGEMPMLIQANHYAAPSYPYTSIDMLYSTPRYHIGGTLWHSFDHQRGYHPDPFYGGIMTAFRRPKYSYYMFQSQSYTREPMVYIANEMTPFSPEDVTVYSNCDEVRLHTQVGDSVRVYHRKKRDALGGEGMLSPIIKFEKAFDVMTDKAFARGKDIDESYLLAEGYNDGKLVASFKRMPTRRPTKIEILIDTMSASPVATGGDLLVVVARITDDAGNVKRLNNEWIHFEVQGEATIVGGSEIHCNPAPIEWGEAPVILQTTTVPGKVVVKASVQFSGDHTPVSGSAEFTTVKPTEGLIYDSNIKPIISNKTKIGSSNKNREEIDAALREVERQQDDFGEKNSF
ncbi:MAG: glycoside hydrolase family 2 TIM barrel-domain containing protein, partial [Rikenellaceae bacterium]